VRQRIFEALASSRGVVRNNKLVPRRYSTFIIITMTHFPISLSSIAMDIC